MVWYHHCQRCEVGGSDGIEYYVSEDHNCSPRDNAVSVVNPCAEKSDEVCHGQLAKWGR